MTVELTRGCWWMGVAIAAIGCAHAPREDHGQGPLAVGSPPTLDECLGPATSEPLAVVLTAPDGAWASRDPSAADRSAYVLAESRINVGDHRGALAALLTITPTRTFPGIALLIARAQREVGYSAAAAANAELAVQLASSVPTQRASFAAEAARVRDETRGQTVQVQLDLHALSPGAQARVDGRAMTDGATAILDAGTHEVRAFDAQAERCVTRTIDLRAGDRVLLRVDEQIDVLVVVADRARRDRRYDFSL
ncbi:MAG: hypothetical protein K8W52_17645 [Deltaproteobacteria bacterium]|nr:hypothetical protein [Deltaproteobacteria bacterium]